MNEVTGENDYEGSPSKHYYKNIGTGDSIEYFTGGTPFTFGYSRKQMIHMSNDMDAGIDMTSLDGEVFRLNLDVGA